MVQVLSDIKVLDLTWYIAGPYCTKLLADYGADVIKVERPGQGDPARGLGPFLNDEPHPEKSGLFLHLNTNKRGITLNLKHETGKRIFKELVKDADVLVESFRPRVMPSLGLDYETLDKINPRLVMTSISNFGQRGPYRDFKGSELIYQGFGGFMYLMGTSDREPAKKSGNVIQYQLGLASALATMVALFGAQARGYGDHVDTSGVREELTCIDGKMSMLSAYQYTGHVHRRNKAGSSRHIRRCKDGYVFIVGVGATTGALFFPQFAKMLKLTPEQREKWGKPDVLNDSAKGAEFDEKFLAPWLLERTMREVVEESQAAGIMATPHNTPGGLLRDPHFRERGYWVEIEHPVAGKLTYSGAPFRMGEGGWEIRRPAPFLGQHNEEVYGNLGYSKNDLVQLKQAGII
jgi:crotonobetainyl-CoA:carnitine CoA-transferase CaiB-like acyl-CoA transferase